MGLFGEPDRSLELEQRVARLEHEVARLTRLTDALAAASESTAAARAVPGEEETPGWRSMARGLVAKGQKIEAIKLVRDLGGLSLADAKSFVDRL